MNQGLKQLLSASTLGLAATFLISCQPYQGQGGDLSINVRSQSVLLDAPSRSCVGLADISTDLQPLHMSLGRVQMEWAPPTPTSTLEVIYIRITLRSGGLSQDVVKTIAADELNCIFGGSIIAAPTLAATSTSKTFEIDLKIGSISPADSSKATSFSGSGEALIYALVTDGDSQTPYKGRTTFRFSFDGIR